MSSQCSLIGADWSIILRYLTTREYAQTRTLSRTVYKSSRWRTTYNQAPIQIMLDEKVIHADDTLETLQSHICSLLRSIPTSWNIRDVKIEGKLHVEEVEAKPAAKKKTKSYATTASSSSSSPAAPKPDMKSRVSAKRALANQKKLPSTLLNMICIGILEKRDHAEDQAEWKRQQELMRQQDETMPSAEEEDILVLPTTLDEEEDDDEKNLSYLVNTFSHYDSLSISHVHFQTQGLILLFECFSLLLRTLSLTSIHHTPHPQSQDLDPRYFFEANDWRNYCQQIEGHHLHHQGGPNPITNYNQMQVSSQIRPMLENLRIEIVSKNGNASPIMRIVSFFGVSLRELHFHVDSSNSMSLKMLQYLYFPHLHTLSITQSYAVTHHSAWICLSTLKLKSLCIEGMTLSEKELSLLASVPKDGDEHDDHPQIEQQDPDDELDEDMAEQQDKILKPEVYFHKLLAMTKPPPHVVEMIENYGGSVSGASSGSSSAASSSDNDPSTTTVPSSSSPSSSFHPLLTTLVSHLRTHLHSLTFTPCTLFPNSQDFRVLNHFKGLEKLEMKKYRPRLEDVKMMKLGKLKEVVTVSAAEASTPSATAEKNAASSSSSSSSSASAAAAAAATPSVPIDHQLECDNVQAYLIHHFPSMLKLIPLDLIPEEQRPTALPIQVTHECILRWKTQEKMKRVFVVSNSSFAAHQDDTLMSDSDALPTSIKRLTCFRQVGFSIDSPLESMHSPM